MKITLHLLASFVLALFSTLALAGGGEPAPEEPPKGIIPVVDDQGRQLILQGLNASQHAKHSYMRRSWETETDVAHQAKALGYNSVRYLIFWDHVMPAEGVIDNGYLNDVATRLDWYADNDMYVILDMHQDNWGEQCGGNGAPAWATIGHEEEVGEGPWWLKAASPCVVDSTNAFWGNSNNIQEHFAQSWRAVAKKFRNHPAVIGYDLFNEPNRTDAIIDQMVHEMLSDEDKALLNTAVLGTVWVDGHPYNAMTGVIKDKIRQMATDMGYSVPESYVDKIAHTIISRNYGDWGELNVVHGFEHWALSDLYQRVIDRIREVDSDNYIFVEPMSVSVNHGFGTYLRRLNDPAAERRLGYIPHMYPRDLHEGGTYLESDFSRVDIWESNQSNFVYENNMAWLMGEFGHSNYAPGAQDFLRDAVRMARENNLGWAFWVSDKGGWGPIASDGVSDMPNAQELVIIYPRAVAGQIEYYDFQNEERTFVLEYSNNGATGSTEIALPPRFYPDGFVIESSDADGTWSWQHDTEKNILYIDHNPAVSAHSISIKPAGTTQVPLYRELKDGRSGKCLDFTGLLPQAGKNGVIWNCEGKTWQRWYYDTETQFLRNFQNTDYCLSHGDPSQAVDGGPVEIALCSDSDDHRWISIGNSFRNIYNTNIAMDAFGTDNNANVGQWSYHGGANQQWSWGNH